jgi:hypothetical protein
MVTVLQPPVDMTRRTVMMMKHLQSLGVTSMTSGMVSATLSVTTKSGCLTVAIVCLPVHRLGVMRLCLGTGSVTLHDSMKSAGGIRMTAMDARVAVMLNHFATTVVTRAVTLRSERMIWAAVELRSASREAAPFQ